MSAKLLLKDKLTDEDGHLLEWVLWEVPVNQMYRDGDSDESDGNWH